LATTNGVQFPAGFENFYLRQQRPYQLQGPTQPHNQWVLEVPCSGVKLPGREADHSPQASAKVKNAWSYTCIPPYVFMAWCLVKHREKFTIAFFILVQNNNVVKVYCEGRGEIQCLLSFDSW